MSRMVRVALFLAVAVGASAADLAVIKSWAQCGGTSCQDNTCSDSPWAGTQCTDGFDCVRMTSFFWQCKPVATLFGQCGGQGGECKGLCGDKAWAACPKGGACLRQTAFYWQCVKEEDYEELSKQYSVQSVSVAAVDSVTMATKAPQKPSSVPTAPAKTADKTAKAAPAKPAPAQQQKPAAPATVAPKPDANAPQTTAQTPAADQQAKAAPRFSWPWSRAANKP